MRYFTSTLCLSAAVFLSGCQISDSELDPYEDYNREIFAFNQQADEHLVQPIVSLYQTVLPLPFRLGITNFYSNLAELSYAFNFMLQGEYEDAYKSSLRLVVNTTFGVGGLFDMAHDLGLPKKRNDFGKTLYTWGCTQSPYVVSPFWGPSTMRDMLGMSVDRLLFNPLTYTTTYDIRSGLMFINAVDTRSHLSEYIDQVNNTSFVQDRYLFVRDAYLQFRQHQLDADRKNWEEFYDQEWLDEDSAP